MGKTMIRKPLTRAEFENFYVMTRAYYPGAEFLAENDYDGFGWLFGYDVAKHEFSAHTACVMVQGTDMGVRYYVGVKHGHKAPMRRICRTYSAKRFLTALRKLSEIDWICDVTNAWIRSRGLSAESAGLAGTDKV